MLTIDSIGKDWLQTAQQKSVTILEDILWSRIPYSAVLQINSNTNVGAFEKALPYLPANTVYYMGTITKPDAFLCYAQEYYVIGQYDKFFKEQQQASLDFVISLHSKKQDIQFSYEHSFLDFMQRWRMQWIKIS